MTDQLIWLQPEQLRPNPDNPRHIVKDQFEKLVKSIMEFPQMLSARGCVVVSIPDEEKDGLAQYQPLGGNMRLQAFPEAKRRLQGITGKEAAVKLVILEKGIPCFVADHWDKNQRDQFIIKDNVSFGEWDYEALANQYDPLVLDDWGLKIPDFKPLSAEVVDDDFQTRDASEVHTDILEGDLFEIGQHRLLCGSSTNADHVEKLMDGCVPALMVTDPPYGVKYDASWRDKKLGEANRQIGKVENDDLAKWNEAYALFPGTVAYVWHSGKFSHIVAQDLIDCEFDIVAQIIWAKQHFAIGMGDYHWKHEGCWYAVKKGAKHSWQGSRKEHTVWEINNGLSQAGGDKEEKTGHSTQKPLECMARPIRNNTYERETVYDPFGGSGTTMVAGHKLNRKVLMCELKPEYVQIILDRMLKLDPTLEVKRNGQPYERRASLVIQNDAPCD